MRSAALQGKVALGEDVLTASFFDLFRSHDEPELMRKFLALARPVNDEGKLEGRTLTELFERVVWDRYQVAFWVRWPVGEPDVVLDLFRETTRVASIVVEAKAGSSKSGVDAVVVGREDANANHDVGDQLAVYLWHAERIAANEYPTALIFLTHHAIPPRDELRASIVARNRRGTKSPIAWAAWRDVEDILETHSGETSGSLRRDIADSATLLRRFGYFRFRGRWRLGPELVALLDSKRRVVWQNNVSSRFDSTTTQPGVPALGDWRGVLPAMPPLDKVAYWRIRATQLRTYRLAESSLSPVSTDAYYRGDAHAK